MQPTVFLVVRRWRPVYTVFARWQPAVEADVVDVFVGIDDLVTERHIRMFHQSQLTHGCLNVAYFLVAVGHARPAVCPAVSPATPQSWPRVVQFLYSRPFAIADLNRNYTILVRTFVLFFLNLPCCR